MIKIENRIKPVLSYLIKKSVTKCGNIRTNNLQEHLGF